MLALCAYLWLPPLDSITDQRVQPQAYCSKQAPIPKNFAHILVSSAPTGARKRDEKRRGSTAAAAGRHASCPRRPSSTGTSTLSTQTPQVSKHKRMRWRGTRQPRAVVRSRVIHCAHTLAHDAPTFCERVYAGTVRLPVASSARFHHQPTCATAGTLLQQQAIPEHELQ